MRRQKKEGRILLLRNCRACLLREMEGIASKQIKGHGQNQGRARLTKKT